ncbi:60Kd inner membrane protein-domain-containing protein [Mycena alexandri]|uniref:60Kd inner membrane protein-domain-containing protein n=1 Tax=Mycena alexandri TaxID=1745969 RepID=A0AAD6XGH1_9AGAR|nr:60Kd inner membrane protein-domain-containing protein [Mycena alexandri]
MFAVGTRPLQRVPRRCLSNRQPLNKRYFIQSLCDGFLDLAVALPYPPSVPAYSATIILVTVASRLVLFPVALWSRNCVRRIENVVLPELERLKPIISKQILEDMKREGLPKELLVPAKLQRIHVLRLIAKVKAEQKRLLAEHKCRPGLAMVASPVSQLPVFVVMSMVFNRLAQEPTPFDSEAFFTLSTLNHTDSTLTLPIILGMITMLNVDANSWFMSAVQKDRLQKMEEKRAATLAAGQRPGFHLQRIIKSSLNYLSVFRIILAAISPGSVVLYWTTSAACGLIQTFILDYRPKATAPVTKALAAQSVPVIKPPQSVSPNSPKPPQPASSKSTKSPQPAGTKFAKLRQPADTKSAKAPRPTAGTTHKRKRHPW